MKGFCSFTEKKKVPFSGNKNDIITPSSNVQNLHAPLLIRCLRMVGEEKCITSTETAVFVIDSAVSLTLGLNQ